MDSYIKRKSQEISNSLRLSKILRYNLIKKDKNIFQYKEDDNNYIDYFFEIGVKPEIFNQKFLYETSINELNIKLKPEIISKFPDINKKSIIIDNNELINQVFPNGLNILEAKEKPDSIFFSIMSDNYLFNVTYRYKYFACLMIYESINDYKKLYDLFNNNINTQEEENKNCINNFNNLFIPKCLCFVSVHPCIDKFEDILKCIYENMINNKFNEIFLHQLIEEIVMKIPKIPHGYKRVFINIAENQIELTENKLNELPSIHINLRKFFATFKINIILEIFKFILYEGKLIFFSSKIYDLTNIIMSFLFLLSPFQYQYQVISILPKDKYFFIESDISYIFGINEKYQENFFSDNKLNLKENEVICIIDLDEKTFITIPNQYNIKDYPAIPKHLKEIIENKVQHYYNYLKNESKINLKEKNNKTEQVDNKVKEQNEKYQSIFYKFMIAFLSDYPKYLVKSKHFKENNMNENDINNMIDINSYLNSINVSEKEFYKKIFKTKSFKEFILKRFNPKNSLEKIEAIFFEEKINENIADNKVFGKNKIKEQNKLLLSKEYDYISEPEIIDLSIQNLKNEYIELFKDEKFIKEKLLTQGYSIELNHTNNNLNYKYYIFPSLINFNSLQSSIIIPNNTYPSPPLLYKYIDLINAKMSKVSSLKFLDDYNITKNYTENDLYICYILLWCLTCWYTEDKEKEYRFGKMLQILDKIKYKKNEIYNLLIEYLNMFGYSDDDIFYVYIKLLNKKINPNLSIFNIILDVIKRKINENKKENLMEILLNHNKKNNEIIQSKISQSPEIFTKRKLKTQCDFEDNIISDDVEFICYTKCIGCGKNIDIGNICTNLNNMNIKNNNGIDMIKCYHKDKKGKECDYYNCLKLKFRYGMELFNNKVSNYSMSKFFNLPLLSPTNLKERLFKLSKYYKELNEKINIELFKKKHQIEFWNSFWYFKILDIDISFILPYDLSEKNNIDIGKNELSTSIKEEKIKFNKSKEEIIIEKNYSNKKYKDDDLYIQIVHQFAFIKDIGMVSYKNIFLYENNINYNEIPLMFKDNNFDEENINIPLKKLTLKRAITSKEIHESIVENNNDNNFLKSNDKKKALTLNNSSSCPMIINSSDLYKINKQNIQKKY